MWPVLIPDPFIMQRAVTAVRPAEAVKCIVPERAVVLNRDAVPVIETALAVGHSVGPEACEFQCSIGVPGLAVLFLLHDTCSFLLQISFQFMKSA